MIEGSLSKLWVRSSSEFGRKISVKDGSSSGSLRTLYNLKDVREIRVFVRNITIISTEIENKCLRFEVLTALIMKGSVFWDITPCSPLEANKRFGETWCLHLRDRRVFQASNMTCGINLLPAEAIPPLNNILIFYNMTVVSPCYTCPTKKMKIRI
jgi:hypothetical protein